jgi:hypothetical protein
VVRGHGQPKRIRHCSQAVEVLAHGSIFFFTPAFQDRSPKRQKEQERDDGKNRNHL